jgi:hypothetical protein
VTPDFSAKLKSEGINSTITGEKGNWTITQVLSGWNQDGTPNYEKNVNVASFSANASAIHNISYPDGILTGTDSQGKIVVFWSEEEKAWVRPLEISKDIEKPTFYPWGKQYIAIESALLNPALNAPFSDDAVKNFAGWSIDFEYDGKTDSSQAYLRPRNNQSIRWALDETGMPVWFTTTTPDGKVYESALTQLLNPDDPAHPKADETIFTLASAGEWLNNFPIVYADYRELFNSMYLQDGLKNDPTVGILYKKLLPQIILAQRGNWNLNHPWGSFPGRPSLDSLLSQPGNSLDKLGALGHNINVRMDQMGPSQKVFEITISNFPELLKELINIQNTEWPLSFATK